MEGPESKLVGGDDLLYLVVRKKALEEEPLNILEKRGRRLIGL
jgi:hypothetical protein